MNQSPEFELLPKEQPVQPASDSRPTNPPPSKRRLALALAVAVISDLLSFWLEFVPPVQWTLDVLTAVALFAILGRQWVLLPALVAEAIPGVAMFPVWILVVVAIGAWGSLKPNGPKS